MDLIGLGSKLIANGLPVLGKLLAGENGEYVANEIVNFLGIEKAHINKIIDNPELLLKLNALENQKIKMLIDNTKYARDMYITTNNKDFVNTFAKNIIKLNTPTIILLLLINVAIVLISLKFKLNVGVVASFSNLIGVVVGRLLEERSLIEGFFFGSSIEGNNAKIHKERK